MRKRIFVFIIDETVIQISWEYYYLLSIWIDSVHNIILEKHISGKRNMLVARQFLHVDSKIRHSVYSDGNTISGSSPSTKCEVLSIPISRRKPVW